MLTLDALRRMADRMPAELDLATDRPPYGRGGHGQPRRVTLPPIREEVRRAVALFLFFVSVAVTVLTTAGLLTTHASALVDGQLPSHEVLVSTGLWFAGWSASLAAPFAALGLGREVRRYVRARRLLGPVAWLDPAGWLWNEDRSRRWPLRPSLSAAGRG
ncbi:MAG: hypothetical protein RLP09_00815 [Sandaracinaceae bacterium]